MSFDAPFESRPNIAIIGGGISGMASAYLLPDQAKVTVFEAGERLGGHARTVMAGRNGDQPVDTGFIVFNFVNYPHLTKMFNELDVPVQRSDMSFGATIDDGRLEYGLAGISALLAQKSNVLSPSFIRMVRDIVRFNRDAEHKLAVREISIGTLVDEMGFGAWFRDYYLLPMCGAIWSTPASQSLQFPAETMIQFFQNHGLMSSSGQHQWWTVKGGSQEYVKRLSAHLKSTGVDLKTSCAVKSVKRDEFGATLHFADRPPEHFDHVVFACHPDQALGLLANPTPDEKCALGSIKFQDNKMVLHRDETQMPQRRACWSSWVYHANMGKMDAKVGVTYWMNKLQNIPMNDPLFVSLNPTKTIAPDLIYDEKVFRHPVFDLQALAAQKTLAGIQGQYNTWFAGAYLRNGFHEDGFASAVRISRQLVREMA